MKIMALPIILIVAVYSNFIQLPVNESVAKVAIDESVPTNYIHFSAFLMFEDSDTIIERVFNGLEPKSPYDIFDFEKTELHCIDASGRVFTAEGYVVSEKESNMRFLVSRPIAGAVCYPSGESLKYRRLVAEGFSATVYSNKVRSRVLLVSPIDLAVIVLDTGDELVPKIVMAGENEIYVKGHVKNVYVYDGLNLYIVPNVEYSTINNIPFEDVGIYSQPEMIITDYSNCEVELTDTRSSFSVPVEMSGNIIRIHKPPLWPALSNSIGVLKLKCTGEDGVQEISRKVNIFSPIKFKSLVFDTESHVLVMDFTKSIKVDTRTIRFVVLVNGKTCANTKLQGSTDEVRIDLKMCDLAKGFNNVQVIMEAVARFSGNVEYSRMFWFAWYTPYDASEIRVTENEDGTIHIESPERIYAHVVIVADSKVVVHGYYSLPENFYIGEFGRAEVFIDGVRYGVETPSHEGRSGALVTVIILIVIGVGALAYFRKSAKVLPAKDREPPVVNALNTRFKMIASGIIGRPDVYLAHYDYDESRGIVTAYYQTPVGRGLIMEICAETGEIVRSTIFTGDIVGEQVQESREEVADKNETSKPELIQRAIRKIGTSKTHSEEKLDDEQRMNKPVKPVFKLKRETINMEGGDEEDS